LIATDVPGCREIVRPDETGLLVNPGDPVALADAMARLAADGALRRRLGAGARARVAAGLDAGTVGRETVAVYQADMSRGRTA